MVEREAEVVSTSGFKVRPLTRQKAEGSEQKAEPSTSTSSPHSLVDKSSKKSRLRELTNELRELEAKLRLGGGAERVERQHKQRKLTARERIDLLLDKDSVSQEIGLLVAYDQYKPEVRSQRSEVSKSDKSQVSSLKSQEIGGAPAAGVVTTVGRVSGREVVVVANDATVKAGSWWPETIKKILRAQEIAMRSRIPIIYLVDSAGVNLPYQGGVFPGQYG